MTIASPLLYIAATAIASATDASSQLWNGIATGQSMEAVARQVFIDARDTPHILSRHATIRGFYLQRHDRATVRVLFRGKPGRVCGVDIEGARATLESDALLSDLGPPASREVRELLDSPGGAAALLTGGKLFRVSTWRRGATVITFEERLRPGYFVVRYRGTDTVGDKVDC